MMTFIREKTHVLLYVLVFCFIALIVVEWGAQYSDIANKSRGTIGKINGNEVRYAEFATVYNNQMNNYRAQKEGEALTDAEMENISEQIWNQMIEEHLLREYIAENHIAVGDSEVVYDLRFNPPDFLKQSPSFQTDSKFDITKYQQALNNPQFAKDWVQVEQLLRAQLPYNKLQAMISTSPRVTESELRTEYARRNLKLNGQLIYFSPSSIPMSDISVTDEEILTYYNGHKEDFKEKEKARLAYVIYNTEATKEDSVEVFEKLAEAKKQAAEGQVFGELAKLYSSDRVSNQSNGSVGWFTKDSPFAQEFKDACFGMKKGDVVGPVKTSFGYHIIKIDSTRYAKDLRLGNKANDHKDSVSASHILIKMEASPNTIETARENANAFYESAKDEGFAKALEKFSAKFSLTADTTLELVNNDNGIVAGFGERMKSTLRFAFEEKPGAVQRPHLTGRGFSIFTIVDRKPEGISPLADVKERVHSSVAEEKRKSAAVQKAKEFRSKLASVNDVKKIDSTISVKDLAAFTMNSSIPGVGRDPKLNGMLFSLSLNQLSDVLEGARGAYIVQVFSRDDLNEARYNDARNELRRQLMSAKQQRIYRDWLEMTKKDASIKDFRSEFNL